MRKVGFDSILHSLFVIFSSSWRRFLVISSFGRLGECLIDPGCSRVWKTSDVAKLEVKDRAQTSFVAQAFQTRLTSLQLNIC